MKNRYIPFGYQIQNGDSVINTEQAATVQHIPKQFRDEAAAYYANAEPDDYLMPSRYGGQMSSRGVAEMLQKYAIKYGIDPKYMHPHSFRHLFAIEFLKRNNNLSLLADLLGHSSVATTAIYTRLTREEQQNALDDAVNW